MSTMRITETKGKTIASVEVINAEWGRTFPSYICFLFTDGTKVILAGCPHLDNAKPDVDEMRKAPNFFSAEQIADEVLQIERKRREYQKQDLERKRREFEGLASELGQKISS